MGIFSSTDRKDATAVAITQNEIIYGLNLPERNEISIIQWLDKLLAKGAYGFAAEALQQGISGLSDIAVKRALSRVSDCFPVQRLLPDRGTSIRFHRHIAAPTVGNGFAQAADQTGQGGNKGCVG